MIEAIYDAEEEMSGSPQVQATIAASYPEVIELIEKTSPDMVD